MNKVAHKAEQVNIYPAGYSKRDSKNNNELVPFYTIKGLRSYDIDVARFSDGLYFETKDGAYGFIENGGKLDRKLKSKNINLMAILPI